MLVPVHALCFPSEPSPGINASFIFTWGRAGGRACSHTPGARTRTRLQLKNTDTAHRSEFSSHRTVLGEGRGLPALIFRRDVLYPLSIAQGDLCPGCSLPESCRQHGWGWRAQPWTPGVTPASTSPLICTVPRGKERFYFILFYFVKASALVDPDAPLTSLTAPLGLEAGFKTYKPKGASQNSFRCSLLASPSRSNLSGCGSPSGILLMGHWGPC